MSVVSLENRIPLFFVLTRKLESHTLFFLPNIHVQSRASHDATHVQMIGSIEQYRSAVLWA